MVLKKNGTIRQITWNGVNDKLVRDSNTVAQLKYDGSEAYFHIRDGKIYGITSKRISKKSNRLKDNTAHFPHIVGKKLFNGFRKETVLVGEFVAEHLREQFDNEELYFKDGKIATWKKRCNYVSSILNSTPNGKSGKQLKAVIFDILMYEGEDVSKKPYRYKYELIRMYLGGAGKYGENLESFTNEYVFGISNIITHRHSIDKNIEFLFLNVTKRRFEGLVLKDMSNNNSEKLKRENEADCIIIDYTQGTKKYAKNKWIGSIIVAAFVDSERVVRPYKNKTKLTLPQIRELVEDGSLIAVGKISGFDEELRAKISENKGSYRGKIVHCKYMEWSGKAMRHPRIGVQGIRDDKYLSRCRMNQFD